MAGDSDVLPRLPEVLPVPQQPGHRPWAHGELQRPLVRFWGDSIVNGMNVAIERIVSHCARHCANVRKVQFSSLDLAFPVDYVD